jgi:tetratricopeptide (TPR) repeat protein
MKKNEKAETRSAEELNEEFNLLCGKAVEFGRARDFEAGLKLIDEALALGVQQGRGFKVKGNLYSWNKQYAEAVAAYTKALEFMETPNDIAICLMNRATNNVELKNMADALADLEKCSGFFPNDPKIEVLRKKIEDAEPSTQSGVWQYKRRKNGVKLTAWEGSEAEVTIPETLDGFTVIGIGDKVFNNKGLKKVCMPDTIEFIEWQGFSENQLTEIKLPKSLRELMTRAFAENHLTNVILPEGLTKISDSCFEQNEIKNILIPDSVTVIEESAFSYNLLEKVTIPPHVKVIGDSAFFGNKLTELVISFGVKEIQTCAFQSNDLTHLRIPSSVTNIGDAFHFNPLETISLAADVNVGSMGNYFDRCYNRNKQKAGTYKCLSMADGKWQYEKGSADEYSRWDEEAKRANDKAVKQEPKCATVEEPKRANVEEAKPANVEKPKLADNKEPKNDLPDLPPPLPVKPALSYYAAIGGKQAGPFDRDTLEKKISGGEITRETLVWTKGMKDWQIADEVEELAELLSEVPPPLPVSSAPSAPKAESRAKTKTTPKAKSPAKAPKDSEAAFLAALDKGLKIFD